MNLEDKKLHTIKDGITKVIDYSKRIGNRHLISFLNENCDTGLIKIHRDCQKDVYNALKRNSTEPSIWTPRECKPARRESIKFNWKHDCFYCEEECKVDPHNPNRIAWCEVRTLPVKENILHECLRKKNEQSEALRMRLLSINDLVAAGGRYHKNCRQNFFHKTSKSVGRPVNATCDENINAVSQWLEKEAEVYTLGEIHQKMVDLAGSKGNGYSIKWMKKKLKDRYKEHVNFVAADAKTTKLCFKDMIDYLINKKWYENKLQDKNDKAQRIIITATKLVIEDIRSKKYDSEYYTSKENMSEVDEALEWLSPYLRLFLQNLVKSDIRQVAFGQAIT